MINLVDEVSLKYSVDQVRIYFAGHSNGGFMVHRMACDHASRIAGIVSFAGMNFKDISLCKPSEPVNILQIHGTADDTILYNGGVIAGVEYPSVQDVLDDWISLNGCTANSLTDGTPFSILSDVAGAETTPKTATCPAGVSVEHWKMENGIHNPLFE